MNRHFPATWLRPAPMALELDRFIQDFWKTTAAGRAGSANAGGGSAMNVYETPEAFEVEMELPGLALEEIEVVLEGRELNVRGERKSALPEGASWQRRERFHGNFARALQFGVDLDAERVQARLHQGVLTVTLAKAESAKARRIPVAAMSGEQKNQG